MWIKLCLLLVYICLLFLLSRLLETISWCELSSSGVLSCQLLDPMRLSVAKLKCLLDQRGVSYDGILEKSELTRLVEVSGPVNAEDLEVSCYDDATLSQTNFTSGAHFIEEVEDAKDSVWLVQVVTHTDQIEMVMNQNWRNLQRKASYFGVRIGILDCSLDRRYCHRKGWNVPILLLALPSLFEEKANVVMYNYSGPASENGVMQWIHEKFDSRIKRITDLSPVEKESSIKSLQPNIHAILFTQAISAPLIFSALSVKFPGRIKFGLVSPDDPKEKKKSILQRISEKYSVSHLPAFVIYTTERSYTYGFNKGERFSFSKMEIFLKFLYPCLNDIFILSFVFANVLSWLELFVVNSGLFKRVRKFLWCVLKYNLMVIMLWLPVIGLFQMPYLDQIPLLLLKLHRIFTTSDVGSILRGDFVFFVNNPIYVYLSFIVYLVFVTFLCKKYRHVEEDTDNWFNLWHMHTLSHLRANYLFDPMRTSSFDLVGGFEVFGTRFSQNSLWLQPSIPMEYIKHLPTWRYSPQSMASKVELALQAAHSRNPPSMTGSKSTSECQDSLNQCASLEKNHSAEPSESVTFHTGNVPYSNQEGRIVHEVCSRQVGCSHSGTVTPCENTTQSNAPSIDHPTVSVSGENSEESGSGSISTDQPFGSEFDTDRTHISATTSNQSRLDVMPNGFRKGYMESLQCAICLDDYVPLTMLCGLPCGHVFHEKCIISWLNTEKHFCPMCRWPSFKLVTCENQA